MTKQIYILKLKMSSAYFLTDSKEMDELKQELTYKFPKMTRLAISAVNTRYRKIQKENALDFYGLFYMCGEEQKDLFTEYATQADKDLQALDTSLHASAVFMPLDMEAIKRGEMYQQIIQAIYSRIFGSTVEKLENLAKSKKRSGLTERSVEALLKLVNSMRTLNVLADTNVTSKLNRISDLIQQNQIDELQKELQAEIHEMSKKERVLRLS